MIRYQASAKLRPVAWMLCIIVGLSTLAFPQANIITEVEFDDAWTRALAVSKKKNRQVAAISETKLRGNVVSEDRHFEQFLVPDRLRFVDVIESGNQSVKKEFIEIGKVGYVRQDDGPWVEYDVTAYDRNRNFKPDILPRLVDDLAEKHVSTSTSASTDLDGSVVRLVTRSWKADVNGMLRSGRESIWISAAGVILRTETLLEEEGTSSGRRIKRTQSTWEYDPAQLTIVAPTIK